MNELTLTVTVEEGNLIKAGLMELPYKVAFALINKIDEQARKQFDAVENIKELVNSSDK
ncbi:MAG: hypothetical protein MJZ11_13940 [Lachnospiraceae bacterium]|nr:hypothetical protein [Lachnospiraceae bacterium]